MGEEPLQEAEIGKSAPTPPNPVDTANTSQAANLINQNTPFGSLNYQNTGNVNGVNTYTANTTLSPQVQGAVDATLGAQTNVSNAARQLSGNIGSQLGQPIDFAQQQSYLNNLTSQNLNPQWDRLDEQNRTELTNRGLRPGSSAYDTARGEFMNNRSSAYNNANLTNYQTALQGQTALRQMPLNELTALLSAGQVQMPSFSSTPQTDIAGITQAGYANQMAGYNANQAQMGGLFSAGASLIPGLFALSDRDAKDAIGVVGKLDNGLNVWLYQYKTGGPVHIGLMADEVEKVQPHAVIMGEDGFKRVDYSEAVK